MGRSRRRPKRQRGRGNNITTSRRRRTRSQRGRGKIGDFFRTTGQKVASVLQTLAKSKPARQATKRTVGALLKAGNQALSTRSTKRAKQTLQSSLRRTGKKLTRDILRSY